MKEVRKITISKREQYKQQIATVMPDVREIVKKHGLTLVNSCLIKLREYDKKQRHATKLREEADKLERELSETPAKIRAAS